MKNLVLKSDSKRNKSRELRLLKSLKNSQFDLFAPENEEIVYILKVVGYTDEELINLVK